MSKFFRSGSADSDSDSSSSDAPSNEDESADTSEQQELSIQQDVSDLSIASIANDRPVAAAGASAGRDWLLHALLEERCANQVRNEKDPRFRTEEEIQREAKRRYQLLCQTLAPLNLVSAGLDVRIHIWFRVTVAALYPSNASSSYTPSNRLLTS